MDTIEPMDGRDPRAWAGVEAGLEALGRAALLVGADLRVVGATGTVDNLVCDGASQRVLGRPLSDIFGEELMGPEGELVAAMKAGDRQEGRRAFLYCSKLGARLVSLSVVSLGDGARALFGADAHYLVVLRPAEDACLDLQSTVNDLGLATRSPEMLKIVRMIEALHRSDATVLITGESGTGKEVIAQAIHARSLRHQAPFVGVNCAALPGGLLETELFGHVKGAFTGAERDRVGRMELAAEGTLFLDEIGDMPPSLQVKLVRVLQEREYERVGESTPRPFTARVIAATNVDVDEAVEAGQLRKDLYYRLRVVPIHAPPLRERMEDLELLTQSLLRRIGAEAGRELILSPDALDRLCAYDWPGNVRELENTLRYATAMCPGQTIGVENLPDETDPLNGPQAATSAAALQGDDEAERIRAALDAQQWRRADAARALGISRTTLWRRMQALGID